jgi:hypothetical protein
MYMYVHRIRTKITESMPSHFGLGRKDKGARKGQCLLDSTVFDIPKPLNEENSGQERGTRKSQARTVD